jgi:hypothetical protein
MFSSEIHQNVFHKSDFTKKKKLKNVAGGRKKIFLVDTTPRTTTNVPQAF